MTIGELNKQKRQVIILYIATLGGTLLGVLSSIVNTRFLDASDYGDVRYVQNIINLIASLLLFGYFLSGSRLLALSDNENYSKRIRGSMVIILSFCSILLMLSCVLCYFIHLNEKPLVASLFLLSLPVCFYPLLTNYINTIAQGDNHIGRLSLSRFLPSLLYVPIAFFVYNNWGASSSIMIILQWGCYSAILFFIILSTPFSLNNLKHVFIKLNHENREYGLQLYWGSLVMVATNYLAGVTLGWFSSDNTEVGFYTLAMTVTTPLTMLPATIGTTYFKEFARQPKIPYKVMKYTIVITIISCVCFILLIKPLVTYLYSDRYSVVGTYASYLAIGFSIHGIGDMINRYLGSHGQGKSIRNSSFANGILKIFGFTVLVYFFSTPGALLTNILCSTIYCSVLIYYYAKFVKNYEIQSKV